MDEGNLDSDSMGRFSPTRRIDLLERQGEGGANNGTNRILNRKDCSIGAVMKERVVRRGRA